MVLKHVMLCVALVLTYHVRKMQIDHGDKSDSNTIHNISANTALILTLYEGHRPYHHACMAICSDLQGAEKPLCSPSQEIRGLDVQHLQILTI